MDEELERGSGYLALHEGASSIHRSSSCQITYCISWQLSQLAHGVCAGTATVGNGGSVSQLAVKAANTTYHSMNV